MHEVELLLLLVLMGSRLVTRRQDDRVRAERLDAEAAANAPEAVAVAERVEVGGAVAVTVDDVGKVVFVGYHWALSRSVRRTFAPRR